MSISGLEARGRDLLLCKSRAGAYLIFKQHDQTERLSPIQNTPGRHNLHIVLYCRLSVTQTHTAVEIQADSQHLK